MTQYSLSTRGFSAAGAFLAVLLLVVGCGGSSDSGAITVEEGSLTTAQFAKRADTLCKESKARVRREFNAFMQNSANSSGGEEAAGAVLSAVVVPAYERFIDQISALGSPKGDVQEVTDFLNAIQQELKVAEQEPLKVINKPHLFVKAAAIARRYGLTGCASSLL
jgi:hypothetical protein